MKRNRYTREFKAKVALESVKGQKTVNEWASEFGVHVSQINTWKMHLLEELPEVFGRESERREAKNEAERDAALPKSDEAANRGPCDRGTGPKDGFEYISGDAACLAEIDAEARTISLWATLTAHLSPSLKVALMKQGAIGKEKAPNTSYLSVPPQPFSTPAHLPLSLALSRNGRGDLRRGD
jgi:transposase